MILPALFFYLFAGICVASAVMVIVSRNPVHSVLFLILAFVNASGLFVLMGAEFLAMILVVVYVGAVAVLFLFVVMMLDVNFAQLREGYQRYAPVGAAVGVVLLIELAMVLFGWKFAPGSATLRFAPNTPALSNTAQLGRLLYTDYILLFQAAGLVLLVAMIGAIVLTLRDRTSSRHQNIGRQIARTSADTMVFIDVVTGAGVKPGDILRPPVAEPVAEPAAAPAHGGH